MIRRMAIKDEVRRGLERGHDVSSTLDLALGSGREGGVCSLCHLLNEAPSSDVRVSSYT